jgi:hypothetical protein
MSRYPRSTSYRGWAAALLVVTAAAFSACEQDREGDRCNPALIQPGGATPQYNEDECHGSLSCQVPPTCVIAVCCPSQPPYTDPNCACLANPGAACACSVAGLLDAGGEDAASSDSGPGPGDGGTNDAPTDSGADAEKG